MVFRAETGAAGIASHGRSHATSHERAGDAAMEKLSGEDDSGAGSLASEVSTANATPVRDHRHGSGNLHPLSHQRVCILLRASAKRGHACGFRCVAVAAVATRWHTEEDGFLWRRGPGFKYLGGRAVFDHASPLGTD